MKVFKRYQKDKLEFIRWDWKWLSFGAFLVRGNYCKGKGIELFAHANRKCPWILRPLLGWHIGWTKQLRAKSIRWDWSGSMREPFTSWTLRLGRFGIGTSTPAFVQKLVRKQLQKKYEREMDSWDEVASEYDKYYEGDYRG